MLAPLKNVSVSQINLFCDLFQIFKESVGSPPAYAHPSVLTRLSGSILIWFIAIISKLDLLVTMFMTT